MTAPEPAVGDRYEHGTYGVCTVVLGPDAEGDVVTANARGAYVIADLSFNAWRRVEDPPITALSVWQLNGGDYQVVVLADHEAGEWVQCGRLYEWCGHETWTEAGFREHFRPVETQS